MATGRLRLFADLAVGAALAGSQKSAGSRDPRMREELGEQKRVSREGLYEEAVALADKVAAGEEFAAREKARRWLETDTPADARRRGSCGSRCNGRWCFQRCSSGVDLMQ